MKKLISVSLCLLLILSALIFRPFCKYLCPLGAIYALMNRVSLYRMRPCAERCTGCGACARACPMQVNPAHSPNDGECIRCGVCVDACPTDALHLGFRARAESAAERGK